MKFLLLLLLPACAVSQDIPKNTNVIKVSGTSFGKVMNTLLDSNYVIEKSDKEYQTITTGWKDVCKDCIPQIQLYIRIKDSTATVTGKWRSVGDIFGMASKRQEENATLFEIENVKAKVPRICFSRMQRMAKAFGRELVYIKQ